MGKITDETIKEKYGEVKFLDMIDAFEEEASDAKQIEAGYWSEEDDVGVLQDVGFTKEEARYLVYDEQPQSYDDRYDFLYNALSDEGLIEKEFGPNYSPSLEELQEVFDSEMLIQNRILYRKVGRVSLYEPRDDDTILEARARDDSRA